MSFLFLFFAPLVSFLSAKHGVLSGDIFFFSAMTLIPEVIIWPPSIFGLTAEYAATLKLYSGYEAM